MKRLFLSFFLMLSLVSCSNTDQPEYPLIYSGTVNMVYNGFDCSYEVDFDGSQMNITLISPEVFKGFFFCVTEDEIKTQNDSFKLSYEKGVIDGFFPITYLYDVLSVVNQSKPEFVEKGGTLAYDFNVDDHKCEVIIDADTMDLIQVKFDEYVYNMKA